MANAPFRLVLSILMAAPAGVHAAAKREFLITDSGKRVELIWAAPAGPGPWPALVLVHPHQTWPDDVGAAMFERYGVIDHWVAKGFVVAAVSQPGYGHSDGPADFCGPASQHALRQVIGHLRALPSVRRDAIFLYGGSRGATVAGVVAAEEPTLAGVVLKSGLYDFVDTYHRYPFYNPIKLHMIREIGWNDEEGLKQRSVLRYASRIKMPLLVIHGTEDDRASMAFAVGLVKEVNAAGGRAELVTLASEHAISMDKIEAILAAFFAKILAPGAPGP